ncbi:unnamed protein product [Ostreobium quekettii]|uniref:S1 motif domain-containing protein n=1 Tax=Ostreobium quekettii TaxID=121088 RepID=A0A8S1IVD0_9CHLO|nr:unnamed protein product [Ostreobium quekettii]
MGQSIRAKVIKVDEKDNVLVMSERAVLFDEAMGFLNVGDEVKGVVTGVVDYGAFVDIRLQDGLLHGVAGLVHKSELSWDKVATPDALLKEGTEVTAIVTGIDKDLGRISLSLRQAQQDPLRETLDTLLPISEAPPSGSSYAPGGTSLRGLDTIVDALQAVEGIEAVQLGRQANETHVVSQDLEIWLAKEDVPAGFNVVARAGRQLQEVYITTELSRDQMKEVLESVLARTV